MNSYSVPTLIEEGAELPTYGSVEAAGADVRAHITEEIILYPGESKLIPTGLCFEIPKGFEIQVRPRSGLALKHGITVLNTPGTIDSDYRGKVGIILINHGKESFAVTPKMRIAQLVFAPVLQACYIEGECLKATERGEGGFGHTGTH
ncbi:MAG: dUTP diphosphatase [Simkaniaceae bacterium]|jgi:dUTP pyrophosphatase|nr:MAG: dUTP diphosphatase [Simkaniaceae bacterium]